ncbi:MAG: formate dehydrogenase [Xanthobacteraceae bacterium]|jgi:ribulose kinase
MTTNATNEKLSVRRRDVLRALGLGVAVTASAPLLDGAVANGASSDAKRKTRYQPNSQNVQTYYRVNRYPK